MNPNCDIENKHVILFPFDFIHLIGKIFFKNHPFFLLIPKLNPPASLVIIGDVLKCSKYILTKYTITATPISLIL